MSGGGAVSLRARFEASYIPEPMSGCWIWTKGLTGKGYGALLDDGRQSMATRVAWKLYRGAIPAGLFLCHHCDNRACVNPDHLYLGTAKTNIDDAIRRGRFKFRSAPTVPHKTHCKRGHELAVYGRYSRGTGWKCRECNRMSVAAFKAGMRLADWEIEKANEATS